MRLQRSQQSGRKSRSAAPKSQPISSKPEEPAVLMLDMKIFRGYYEDSVATIDEYDMTVDINF